MSIGSVSNVSFKAYVPVRYMAKNPDGEGFSPIIEDANIRKCQSFVVRNLNGTAKNMRNDEFISLYKSVDRDYRRLPKVHSVYLDNLPYVYMVTGHDTEAVKEMAKPIGIKKSEAIDAFGSSRSFESKMASRSYFNNVKNFLKNRCRR